MHRTFLLATLLLAPVLAAAQSHPRQIQQFTTGWRFLQSDALGAESPTFDDSAWKSVTLPHDWSIAGPVEENAPSRATGGFFPTGTGWYRHTLTFAKLDPTKRTYIAFDGVMANSDVYCNGELLGHRPYGYVSFNYDLTPHLHVGRNTIAVRVDDSQQPASRWYPGAGTENVEIYTNAEEVELFLNDKSLGTQQRHADASPITVQIPFAPGTLKAVARTNGKAIAEDELRTAGKPARLLLSTGLSAAHLTNTPHSEATPALTPDWNDIAYVTATLVDANNTVIPDSTTVIHFATTGPGKIIAVDNGNLLDHDPFQAPTPEKDRKLYDGQDIAILRATAASGNITLTATTEGLPPATFILNTHPAKPLSIQRSF